MALPATDDFNRADGTLIAGNWSAPASAGGATSWSISANQAQPNNTGPDYAYWNADAFNDGQYSQYVFANSGTQNYHGPACRVSSAGNGYGFLQESNEIRRVDAGVETVLAVIAATWAVNDVVRMEASAAVIAMVQNGSAIAFGQIGDATYTTGSAGIAGYPGSGNRIDTWQGGNLGADPGGGAMGGFIRPNRLRPRIYKPGLAR